MKPVYLLLFPILFLGACASPQERLSVSENECVQKKEQGTFSHETEYASCLNSALLSYGVSSGWGMANHISAYNEARFDIAKKRDAGKLSEKAAEKQYNLAKETFVKSHTDYLEKISAQEQAQEEIRQQQFQKYLEQQKVTNARQQHAQQCIERHEASMPKNYDTNCWGGASPDGRNIVVHQNCTTSERRKAAPAYIVGQCYDEAQKAIPNVY